MTTLPPVIRIFFAIDLPEEFKNNIGRLIGSLKKQSRTGGIRWSRPDNLHVTLQFLAEVKSEDLPAIVQSVRARVENKLRSVSLTLGSLQLFPNPYRPRVIVLDIGPQAALAALSAVIGEGIRAVNYSIDERPFRAHMTLGRIKQPHDVRLNFLSEAALPLHEKIVAGEVKLYRSEPKPDGSHYSLLETIALADCPEAHV